MNKTRFKRMITLGIKAFGNNEYVSIYARVDGYLAQIDGVYVNNRELCGVEGYYITRLIVPEEIRGQGVASSMMTELVKLADDKEVSLVLEVNSYGSLTHEELIKFYEKYGFSESAEQEGVYIRKANKQL